MLTLEDLIIAHETLKKHKRLVEVKACPQGYSPITILGYCYHLMDQDTRGDPIESVLGMVPGLVYNVGMYYLGAVLRGYEGSDLINKVKDMMGDRIKVWNDVFVDGYSLGMEFRMWEKENG